MKRAQHLLLDWYAAHGRAHLPWRRTRDPYRILVSEFMLQQTQVDRALPKYEAFIARFPSVTSLAAASTADVLRLWKGLGYNSRAVRLQQLARDVVEKFAGCVPCERTSLRALAGVGPYTVSALRAFAFEIDDAAVDTNVRRIVHRLLHGVEHPAAVHATAIGRAARELLPAGSAHDWNSAMMDLGAAVCTARAPKCPVCPLRAVCAAAPIDAAALEDARVKNARGRSPQEAMPFKQTTRFARGRIVDRLRDLPPGRRISLLDLHRELQPALGRPAEDVRAIVSALVKDGLVEMHGEQVALRG